LGVAVWAKRETENAENKAIEQVERRILLRLKALFRADNKN
jgi:hypothetical protein